MTAVYDDAAPVIAAFRWEQNGSAELAREAFERRPRAQSHRRKGPAPETLHHLRHSSRRPPMTAFDPKAALMGLLTTPQPSE